MENLKLIDDSAMCLSRKKKGKSYEYFDENGEKITNKKTIKRLKDLVIPPMWTKVMICKFDDGHIQATGRDLKNRKQYIYHSEYERAQQLKKFEKLTAFADALPEIRKQYHQDLKKKRWKKQKLLALIVSILDHSGMRVGNQQYVKNNETYGLTTLRRKHLTVKNGEVSFQYKGKSNQIRKVHIDDHDLTKFIKESAQLPGYELFRYKVSSRKYKEVDSDDVNRYIGKYMGKQFSSKDFRTWVASRLAVEFYPMALEQKEKSSKKKFSNILIKMVAEEMGNTPSVCKDYYVHPTIFQKADSKTIPNPNPFRKSRKKYKLSASEKLAKKIIEESPAK